MTSKITFINRRQRGPQYTVEEFAAVYNLPEDEAARLFRLSGPSRVDLDMLMRVKAIKAASPRTPLFLRLDWVESLKPATVSTAAD